MTEPLKQEELRQLRKCCGTCKYFREQMLARDDLRKSFRNGGVCIAADEILKEARKTGPVPDALTAVLMTGRGGRVCTAYQPKNSEVSG